MTAKTNQTTAPFLRWSCFYWRNKPSLKLTPPDKIPLFVESFSKTPCEIQTYPLFLPLILDFQSIPCVEIPCPKNTLPHLLSVQGHLPPSPVRTHSSLLCHTQWLYIFALLLSTLHIWTWARGQSLTDLLLLEQIRVCGFGWTKEIFRTFYFLYSGWLLITHPTSCCISPCCLLHHCWTSMSPLGIGACPVPFPCYPYCYPGQIAQQKSNSVS